MYNTFHNHNTEEPRGQGEQELCGIYIYAGIRYIRGILVPKQGRPEMVVVATFTPDWPWTGAPSQK
jgi:hypothetical protein